MTADHQELARLMPQVARRALGEPHHVLLGGREWRWGRKGSLVVKHDLGLYINHETGQVAAFCISLGTPWACPP